jgi:hypothetical protein
LGSCASRTHAGGRLDPGGGHCDPIGLASVTVGGRGRPSVSSRHPGTDSGRPRTAIIVAVDSDGGTTGSPATPPLFARLRHYALGLYDKDDALEGYRSWLERDLYSPRFGVRQCVISAVFLMGLAACLLAILVSVLRGWRLVVAIIVSIGPLLIPTLLVAFRPEKLRLAMQIRHGFAQGDASNPIGWTNRQELLIAGSFLAAIAATIAFGLAG